MYSWGAGAYGAHGQGNTADSWLPVLVEGLSDVGSIACGTNHCMAVTKEGGVYAWGQNNHKQLGLGAAAGECKETDMPMKVDGLAGVVAMACGKAHSLAVDKDGAAYAWGRGNNGILGTGAQETVPTPSVVPVEGKATHCSASWVHSAVVTESGTVLSFGSSQAGRLGY